MDDLITWLKAQLDDDERKARKAGAASWSVGIEETSDGENAYYSVSAYGESEWFIDAGATEHEHAKLEQIAAHDPARVLREVEAKRRLIDRCERALGALDIEDPERVLAEDALDLIALPFSDRPGYREEWKP